MSTYEVHTDGVWKWEIEGNVDKFHIGSFKCMVLRHPEFGHLNGYVGCQSEDIRAVVESQFVHGGWTFDSTRNPDTGEESGLYWLGFDCAHSCDFLPDFKTNLERSMSQLPEEEREKIEALFHALDQMTANFGGGMHQPENYKTMEFVKEEIERVVAQTKKTLASTWKGATYEINSRPQ